jgi:hypothetical protein
MTKKVSKIVFYSFLSVVLLIVLLAGYTQSAAFRANLRSLLYETVKTNLTASVFIGEIKGSILTGFSVDTVMIYIDDAPFVESGQISVKYDIIDLLRNRVTVDSVTIINPVISLHRRSDGVWNINRIAKADTVSDTLSAAWFIDAKRIKVRNASFRLVDSTGDYASTVVVDGRRSVNYSNIRLDHIDLEASAFYSPDRLIADISRLAFRSPNENFHLIGLSATLFHTNDTTRISRLMLRTPDSRLTADAQVSGVNVLSIGDLKEFENVQTTLTLGRSSVAMKDLHTFLPVLYFLRGTVEIDGDFEGTFAQLNVRQLNASFAQTDLHLSGTVSNIHHPKELRLNIVSKQSTINPTDVPELLPYFNIPEFTRLGPLTLDFQYVGKPLDFMVISTVKSAAGTVTVDGQMLITEENLHYKGFLAGSDVNLEKIFATSELRSRLNTKAFIEGSGTSIAQLHTALTIEIDSSEFRGIDVSSATVDLKAKEQTLDADVTIASSEGSMEATTVVDFRKEEPAYMFSSRIRNLNLAPILNDEYYVSRLSFDVNRTARSLDILDGISHTSVTVLPSSFRDYAIDSSSVTMLVEMDSADTRRITLRSPVADGELTGRFTVLGFVDVLKKGIDQMIRLYSYQRQVVDSNFTFRPSGGSEGPPAESTNQEIAYRISLKNLQPISVFFQLPMFDAQGTFAGSLRDFQNKTEFAGDLQLQKGIFIQDSTVIQALQTSLRYHLTDIDSADHNHPLPIALHLNLEGFEVGINRTVLRFPKASIQYDGKNGSYSAYSDIDTTMSIGVEGGVSVTVESEQLSLSKLLFTFQGFEVQNTRPITATLSRKGIKIDSAIIIHNGESMFVDGTYAFNGAIDMAASVTGFSLADLSYFSTSPQFREAVAKFGGTVNASASVTGTTDNPRLSMDVTGTDLSYDKTAIGSFIGAMQYQDKIGRASISVQSETDSTLPPDLELNGVIPIDLRFVSVDDRTGIPGLNIELTTSNLRMAALDPFIPELTGMTGRVRSQIHVTGSLSDPLINGTAVLDSGMFILEMSGIPYRAGGTIQFTDRRVTFSDFRIMNNPEDYAASRMDVGGYIDMDGFVPDVYHLRARGELLVLQERSRTPGSSFFGTLIASTGDDSLRFDGNFRKSRITGIVLVRQASLTFPPTQQASAYSSSLYNVVEFVDDTSKPVVDTVNLGSLVQLAQQMTAPHHNDVRTFLDGFGYELTIQTSGTVRINMIFNANAGAYEELYAELNGKLTMVKNESGVRLTGTINVGNESKYTFYKTFNAGGTLSFVGDPQNPQLNILATYEGTHCVGTNPTTSDCIREERVVVTLKIGGTRNVPQIDLGLKTIDQSGKEIERTGDVENDAISFLLTSSPGTPGKFRDELTAQDRDRISEQLASTIGGTYINSLLSSYVMDFVQRNSIPFVKKFEVRQVGADPDIRIGAEVLDAYVNVGGRVFTDVNNANISVEIPLGDKQRRNFMLEVEKKTENFDYTIQARTILGARIFYRFTF